MGKGRKWLLMIVLGAALAVLVLVFINRENEPTYAGHPLNFWVEILGEGGFHPDWQTASNAVAQIGPASLPFLLRWIQHEPAQWRVKLDRSLEDLPYKWTCGLRDSIIQSRSGLLVFGTYKAFDILGTRATPALDELTRLMNATNAFMPSVRATEILGYLGTNALPALLAVIQNPTHRCRWQAVTALGHIAYTTGDVPDLFVPALIACMRDTNDPMVQLQAIIAINTLKASPELCVPALVWSLQSTNAKIRFASAGALAAFESQANSAIPALTNALTDPDPRLRDRVAETLHKIAPEAFTNAPPQ